MEPGEVDPDPSIIGNAEGVDIAVPEANGEMVRGFPRMDGLRRNNVIAGRDDHERHACGLEILCAHPAERTGLVKHMVQRPAQGERRALVA